MTKDPEGTEPDDPVEGLPSEGSRKLDEDAAWREIVENFGDRALTEEDVAEQPDSAGGAALADEPEPPAEASPPVNDPRFHDTLDSDATWGDEGHFVPPDPPLPPPLEPRRKLAWMGLFGFPAVMLAAVVFGWSLPDWAELSLVVGFTGGFGYLVATMPRSRPGDGSGDNGAVV